MGKKRKFDMFMRAGDRLRIRNTSRAERHEEVEKVKVTALMENRARKKGERKRNVIHK